MSSHSSLQPIQPCTNPALGKLADDYKWGNLRGEVRRQFEAHGVECEYCAEQLLADAHLDTIQMIDYIKAHPGKLQAPRKAPGTERWPSFVARIGQTPSWTFAAALLLVLVLVPLYRLHFEPGPMSQWAMIERPEEIGPVHRGGDVEELERTVAADPDQAEAWLELGYLYLIGDQTAEGVTALTKAAVADGGRLQDAARWLLANGYLKTNQIENAQRELQVVAAGQGRHKGPAQRLLEKIQKKTSR